MISVASTASSDLFRALRAEIFKLRRTLALWAAILCPLVVIAMTTAVQLSRAPGKIGGTLDAWNSLTISFVYFLWCLLGLPLFIALETSLLAGLEHRENAWKHLFVLPISRWSVYIAKIIVAAVLVALSAVVLAVGTGIEGFVLATLRPDLGLALPIPWPMIIGSAVAFGTASLLVLAVQTWVATRWPSFTIALGLGIVGTVVGLVLSLSPRSAGPASLFPWSIPFIAIPRPVATFSHEIQHAALLVGILGGIVVAVMGCWERSRGDVQ